jgi:acetoin utilization protein AcuB
MDLVKDLMTADVVTMGPDEPLRTALARMAAGSFRRIPVVREGVLVGIITDRDIRQALNSPYLFHERHVDEYLLDTLKVSGSMTEDPITVSPETPVVDAARLLLERKISGLPVVDGGRLAGIVTVSDLLRRLMTLLEAG